MDCGAPFTSSTNDIFGYIGVAFIILILPATPIRWILRAAQHAPITPLYVVCHLLHIVAAAVVRMFPPENRPIPSTPPWTVLLGPSARMTDAEAAAVNRRRQRNISGAVPERERFSSGSGPTRDIGNCGGVHEEGGGGGGEEGEHHHQGDSQSPPPPYQVRWAPYLRMHVLKLNTRSFTPTSSRTPIPLTRYMHSFRLIFRSSLLHLYHNGTLCISHDCAVIDIRLLIFTLSFTRWHG